MSKSVSWQKATRVTKSARKYVLALFFSSIFAFWHILSDRFDYPPPPPWKVIRYKGKKTGRKNRMSVPEGVPGLMPLVLVHFWCSTRVEKIGWACRRVFPDSCRWCWYFYVVLKRQFSLVASHIWFWGRSLATMVPRQRHGHIYGGWCMVWGRGLAICNKYWVDVFGTKCRVPRRSLIVYIYMQAWYRGVGLAISIVLLYTEIFTETVNTVFMRYF